MKQNIVISENITSDLSNAINGCKHDRVFVLTDHNTREKCWGRIKDCPALRYAMLISIPPGDDNKTIDTLSMVWSRLGEHGATRHSCMINLGGGMVTDLGGMAAATFKRGINFINVPTTLLAMTDASTGGKTGVNFNGLKNEVGVFADSHCVIIDTAFLATLDDRELRSGYAEMLKHSLLKDRETWAELMNYDLAHPDLHMLRGMVAKSIEVKRLVVEQDPLERGLRKALNLGHTIGHAVESLAMRRGRPLPHGYAVAYGLAGELYMSARLAGLHTNVMHQTARYISDYYGRADITCNDYDELLELMSHDKKNIAGSTRFTLLGDIGDIRIDQTACREDIMEALDFMREG